MSHPAFNLSPDLKRLREEGYFVQIIGGLLVMRHVPYVDANRQVRSGTLISTLNLAGDIAQKPDPHTIYFDGDYPCNANGTPIEPIRNQTQHFPLSGGLSAKHQFSSKPSDTQRYDDYFHKMTTYAATLSGPAAVLKPGATPRSLRKPEDDEQGIFNYTETASDRAGIGALTEKLSAEKIAIIGVGGTGSYVLDFVSKTPVREIRLIDGDEFLQHNAFRAPGAASIEELREAPKKVDYLKGAYSKMHRGIVAHPVQINPSNVHLLDGITFAFVCMDGGEAKRVVIQKLEVIGASFVDVGMGLELVDGSLGGILRVTASTPAKREHVHQGRISFVGGGADDIYSSNIQVADLNAMNAIMAVIKWKKLRGFYRDLEGEHHSTYTTDGDMLLNNDLKL
jgi:hypothetical protein